MLQKINHQLGISMLSALQSSVVLPNNKKTYSSEIRRSQPTAMVFLIDQSGSMSETMEGVGESKAVFLARAVNQAMREIISTCTRTEGVRHYMDIVLIGYGGLGDGKTSSVCWQGELEGKTWVSTTELAATPLGSEKVTETKLVHNVSKTQTKTVKYWLSPVASSLTPMGAALEHASLLLTDWIANHPTSYPPTVFNFTDGAQTDCSDDDLVEKAKFLKNLHTEDGNVLLFNCHISTSKKEPIYFPSSRSELPVSDKYAQLMYNLSSDMPEKYAVDVATLRKTDIPTDSVFSAMVYQADDAALVRMLDIGSRSQRTMIGRDK
ncbi:MAG: hypothetical protein COZ18_02335 [Flexibacter sp. CG_4_10_14_3_um_filter_32_15]|nr:MAG: hypothetical protein COZ18_02335 [Flexibacter sp. CG_4_10_14_3_um_filter_32_15]